MGAVTVAFVLVFPYKKKASYSGPLKKYTGFCAPALRTSVSRVQGRPAFPGRSILAMDTAQQFETIRRQLMTALEAGPCGVRQLSQELHQSEKEIYQHLVHVERSLRTENRRLVVEPPVCLQCGFIFSGRTRPGPPGRCPRCRETRIRRPRYWISPGKR
jgi:predicted Zn-ribbon and HTH transcriptional regulator